MLNRLASDAVLDAAYGWLCHRRRDYPDDADVWSFRRHWPGEKQRIQSELLAGEFRFALLDRVTLADGSDIDLWAARGHCHVNRSDFDRLIGVAYRDANHLLQTSPLST